ncbi:MAG: hypothetical protein R3F12_02085 [Lysobacteraceae bacterium]|nr:hypothetical protein [Xanthomonadales bacterium]HPF74805.1 hypothetical protein [Xanthomonadaceae bacterium]HRY01260.1 hypothetical protein [Xanthomonadaceae bacterium]
MRIFRTSFLLAFLLSGSAFAHNTIPSDWCPAGSTVKIVGTFSFTPTQLQAYKESQMSAAEGSCSAKTCGIIDDWYWSNELSSQTCGGLGLRMSRPAEAIPFVSSPVDFNDVVNHHELYRFGDGNLQGVCAICEPDTTRPVAQASSKF